MKRRSFLQAGLALAAARPVWGTSRTFDVLIVGAGAIGATTAYELRREGLSVALLDKGPAGREASWASAGMIQPYGGDGWAGQAARLSRELYDDLEPRLFEETGKRIGYGGEGGLVLAVDDDEAAAIQRREGFLDRKAVHEREPGLPASVVAALLIPSHRYLDARTYTAVVVEAARKKGVTVKESAAVTGILWDGERVIGVKAGEESIQAGTVVIAAGAWSGKIEPRLALPIKPVRGQIQSLAGPKGGLKHNLQRMSAGGYATPRADGRVIVGATSEDAGYEKAVTPEGLAALAEMTRALVPHIADRKPLDTWSGLRPGSPDGSPAIGPDPRATSGFLWASGHGGYGMMQCPATAKVVADLVMKRAPRIPLASVAPSRFAR
ncbi:MAG TPA: FAD-dependent oxidoreductase [Planctomycetota bacterium]